VTRHTVGVVTIFADKRIGVGRDEPSGFSAAAKPFKHFYHAKCRFG
jgi:hypothetical protein